jgi:hypothetical protein
MKQGSTCSAYLPRLVSFPREATQEEPVACQCISEVDMLVAKYIRWSGEDVVVSWYFHSKITENTCTKKNIIERGLRRKVRARKLPIATIMSEPT